MILAIIGGTPERFVHFAELYRQAQDQSGLPRQPLAVNAHGYVADSMEQAKSEFYGPYARAMTTIGRERGWPPMTTQAFDQMAGPAGAMVIGAPEDAAEKILRMRELLGIERFLLHLSVGTMPHRQVLHAIELFGTKVAALVRES